MAATTSRRMRPRDRWMERLGMPEAECCVLIATLSHWAAFGAPVTSANIHAFLREVGDSRDTRALTAVARRGWIREVGRENGSRMFEPTDRGWRILGLEPMKPPRAA